MSDRHGQLNDQELTSSENKRRNEINLPYSTKLTHNNYKVGWICALPKEQTAATAMLDHIHPDLPKPLTDHNTYTLGSIGRHNIVIACLPKGHYGTNSAATVATWMVSTFPSIKIGLMVGVGGGVPPKVRLGDVVISTPVEQYPGVVQWDFGKVEKGGKFKRTGALNNPPSILLTALTKLETVHEMRGSKIPQYLDDLKRNWPKLASKYTWSASLKDPLYTRCDYGPSQSAWRDILSMLWETILTALGYVLGWWVLAPRGVGTEQATSSTESIAVAGSLRRLEDTCVHYGLIASGNRVIKDAKLRDSLNDSFDGKVLCIEMEAAGLMDNFPCIVIRGICDYADSLKNKDWQEYAAAVAAACAKELLEFLLPSEVDGERPVKETLDLALDALSRTETNVETLRSKLERKEDLEVLNWITTIDYGPQHSDLLNTRQSGTGQWLLNSTVYQAWLKIRKQTLFCPGIPGAGKTILTSIVIDDIYNSFDSSNVGIAFIYCNFQRKEEQKIENLLLSLLKQLAESKHVLPGGVKDLYDYHNTKRTRPSLDEVASVLRSVVAIYSRVFIIIDALDECQTSNNCRSRFLSELFYLQIQHGVNIFATSRLIPEIADQFQGSLQLEIRAREDDIRKFLDHHMSPERAFLRKNLKLQEEIKDKIVQVVDGMFLLAYLHLESLMKKTTEDCIRNALKRLPTGSESYDQAYDEAMVRIENQDPDGKELAKRVLLWIVCARRPLRTVELQHALSVKTGDPQFNSKRLPDIADMVSVCAALVTVDKESSVIRLVHYTTQEYFQRTQKHWFPNAETDITTICVTYLSFTTFESGFCQRDVDLEERLQRNALYKYASQNWGHHAHTASMEVEPLILNLLENGAKVSASSQALMASEGYDGYSQTVPRQVTGVHFAAYFGLENTITGLFKNGHNLDLTDSYGQTPLSWAVRNGQEAVVKLLIEKGAGLESKDKDYGRTPLSRAAYNGHEAVAKLLIEEGADLESKDIYGQTPLWVALENKHEAVVKLLVERGVTLELKDKYGTTPLWLALENGHETLVKLLAEKGADLESKDKGWGQSPLLWAVRNGHEVMVKLLVEKGADLESKDKYGQTPLSLAARKGYKMVVQMLVEKGADLESKDKYGRTPLSWAARKGHETVVKLLIGRDANLQSNDKFGQTPLSLAARNGHEAVVELIVEKDAERHIED